MRIVWYDPADPDDITLNGRGGVFGAVAFAAPAAWAGGLLGW